MRRPSVWCALTVAAALVAGQFAVGSGAAAPASFDTAPNTVAYAYDAAGQLAGVTQTSQGSAAYTYDSGGNVTAVHRTDAAAVSILSVVPLKATPGATVTISGTGFATPAGADTVKFAGSQASVTAATPTALTVTVPDGAGSGTVSVDTGAGTATSTQSFTVEPAQGPLSVTGISPSAGTPGTTVTVSGTGFDPSSGADTVTFGHTRATVTAASPTSLTVTVPQAAGSGPVTVAADGRSAASGSDFVALPSTENAANLVNMGVLTADGAPTPVPLTQSDKYTMLRFAGTKGQRLSLGLTGVSDPSKVYLELFDPFGATFARGEYDYGRWDDGLYGAYDLPTLPSTGTYELIIYPHADNLGTASATLSTKVTKALAVDGAGTPVALTRPGQEAELSLPATQGQALGLGFSGSTFAAGKTVTVTVREPNGAPLLWNGTDSTSWLMPLDGDGEYNLVAPETGTYTVLFSATDESSGSLTVTASNPQAAGALALGTTKAVNLSRPGQDARLTYAASANQELGLDITGNTTPYQPYVTITEPNGAVFWQNAVNGHVDLAPLPTGGTYTVNVSTSSTTGSLSVRLSSRSAASSISATGAAVVARVSDKGDTAQLKFPGTKGQVLAVGFTTWTFPASTTLDVDVEDPDGDTELSYTGITDISEFWFTPKHSGSYHLELTPHDGKSTGSIAVTLSAEQAGGTLATGIETVFSAPRAGQSTRYTFNGTKNQKLSLVFGSPTFAYNLGVDVFGPDGTKLVDAGVWSGVDLDALPSTGTYQVVVFPVGETGTANLRLAPRSTAAAAAVIGGAAASLAIGVLGGVAETSFTAGSSERISVGMSFSDFDVDPVQVRIIAPDGSLLTDVLNYDGGFLFTTTGKSGTYRLVMSPPNGDYGSASFTLSDQVSAGALTLNTAKTVTMPRIGQAAYLTYKGTAGQNLQLSFAKMTTGYRPYVVVHKPDGSSLTYDDSNTDPVVIGTLPTTGTYEIDLDPYASPGAVTVTLGTAPAANVQAAKSKAPAAHRVATPAPKPPTRPQRGPLTALPRTQPARPVPLPAKAPGGGRALPACATCSTGTSPPPSSAPAPGGGSVGGDPVDLGTGLLADTETDLTVPGTLPLAVTRSYQQSDTGIRTFGVGDSSEYDMFLYAPNGATKSQLVLPDGGRITFNRTTPGGSGENDYRDAAYVAAPTPTVFNGAVMAWNGNGFDVRLRDGTTLVFGEDAPLQSIHDRYGNTITITRGPGGYDEENDPLANGPISQVTSPDGRWIRFTTDRLKRVTRAEDNTGRASVYTYDAQGHLATVTDPDGAVSSYTYDAQGRMATAKDGRGIVYLTNQYDDAGRVAKQTLGDGGTYTLAYTTDAADRIVETRLTDQRGTVRRVTYNAAGYATTDTAGYGTSQAQTTTTTRDPATNLPVRTVDALGRRTDFAYDAYGNVTSETELAGTSSARTETFVYGGPYDQLSRSTDWLGRSTAYTYRPDGAPATMTDPMSRVTTVDSDDAGRTVKVTDALGHVTTDTYLVGDLVSTTDALGRVKHQTVDGAGRVVALTDTAGATTTLGYDAADRVLSTTDPLGRVTAFGYDADGNIAKVTDPRGNATTYAYDPENRRTKTTDPLGRVTSYGYDAAGNRTSVTTPNAQVTNVDFDTLGRLSQTHYGVSGTGTESTIGYGYDAGNRAVSVVDSKTGTVTNTYDGFNQLTGTTSPTGSIGYAYDAASRRTGMTVAGQPAVTYGFDADGELTGETQGANTVALGYDGAGRRTSVTLPDGVAQNYAFDAAGEVTGITYQHGTSALGDLSYTYDSAGQVASMGGSNARTTLPAEYGPATYDAASQLTTVGTTPYQYDTDGNLLTDGTTQYTWDAKGQLTGTTRAGATTTYAYDGLGRRTGKTDASGTTGYLYDGQNAVAELTGGTVSASMLTGGTDQVFARTSGGTTRSLLTDALGSTTGVADASGQVTGQYTYGPFGATTATGDGGGNPTQFAGRENDGSGQYFDRARYYSAGDQRFLSPDPTGFSAGDTDLYAYTGNQPTDRVDPMGLSSQQAGQGGLTLPGIVGIVQDTGKEVLGEVWNHRTDIEVALAGAAALAVVLGAAAPVVTTLVVAGMVAGAIDTVDACANGEKLACGAGIAGLAMGGAGAGLDKIAEKVIGENGAQEAAWAVSNVWNAGSIAFTAIGGWVKGPEPAGGEEH
jgi:RHS repeat-associated protein